MTPQVHPGMTAVPRNLHQMIATIAGGSLQAAIARSSFIVNEVPRDLLIAGDEARVAELLGLLVTTVVRNSAQSCIRIKAREYDDIVFVSLRDSNYGGAYSSPGGLERVRTLASQLNGTLSVAASNDEYVTLLLSFPNFPQSL